MFCFNKRRKGNGTKLAFASNRDNDKFAIFVMNSDGVDADMHSQSQEGGEHGLGVITCAIRSKATTESGACRPLNPEDAIHF